MEAEPSKGKAAENTTEVATAPKPAVVVPIQPVRARVNYMAGIVAACSMLVTMSYFALTFILALDSGRNTHYKSELVARKTFGAYFLNTIWLGLFFTTSTRFSLPDTSNTATSKVSLRRR